MIPGEKIRFDIHKILYLIFKQNKTLNDSSIKKLINNNKKEDISFLNNVTLNSMRFKFHSIKIIDRYLNKKIRTQEEILLISAVTQIVFLNFKSYAVINCSVEIAKKLKIYHGFINAILKKISNEKERLKEINIEFKNLPLWFKNKANYLSPTEKKIFINNLTQEPSLHIVFKDVKKLNNFKENIEKTSDISGFLVNKKDFTKMKSFIEGDWWVQDFSSFFPLYNLRMKSKNKKFLDACAAPGGKSFQLLSKGINVVLNDKSKLRIETIKSNLDRLKLSAKILNEDFTKFNEKEKYDFIIVDAPCSAVGTIRKNPEIFFKNNGPNFNELIKLQKSMLEKASLLLNNNGFILYMVCSFLKVETVDQINNFLRKKTNFQKYSFELEKGNIIPSKLIKDNYMLTLPNNILNNKIDGYFAAFLKKTK